MKAEPEPETVILTFHRDEDGALRAVNDIVLADEGSTDDVETLHSAALFMDRDPEAVDALIGAIRRRLVGLARDTLDMATRHGEQAEAAIAKANALTDRALDLAKKAAANPQADLTAAIESGYQAGGQAGVQKGYSLGVAEARRVLAHAVPPEPAVTTVQRDEQGQVIGMETIVGDRVTRKRLERDGRGLVIGMVEEVVSG